MGEEENEVECEVNVTVSDPVPTKKIHLLEYQAVFRTSESPLSIFEVVITVFSKQLLNAATFFLTLSAKQHALTDKCQSISRLKADF